MYINTLDLKIVYDLVMDIYVTIAKIYSLLLNMIDVGTDIETTASPLLNLSKSIYVLACVFILFRITVSFLNMLIDPDKTNDKQVGAGAIIKRVFISIILLIVFAPGSFVFDLLDRFQSAVLIGKDSLINNILEDSSMNAFTSNSLSTNADNSGVVTYNCYTYSSMNFEFSSGGILTSFILKYHGGAANKISDWFGLGFEIDTNAGFTVRNIYDATHFVITNDSSKGYAPISGSSGWYATYVGDTSTKHPYTFVSYSNDFTSSGYKNGFKGCPRNISVKDGKTTLSSTKIKNGIFATYVDSDDSKKLNNISSLRKYQDGIYNSEDSLWNALAYEYHTTKKTINRILINKTDNLFALQNGQLYSIIKELGTEYESVNTTGVIDSNLAFSRSILLTFISSSDGTSDEDLDNVLYNEVANDTVWKKTSGKNATLSMDKLFALLVGIVVAVYLIVLCVDIVVRNLKLFLLRVMAPIPIVSYIDPKDKIFNEWLKMYLSTYADLFIKLFAISIISALLSAVVGDNVTLTGWVKLLYILGLLVFAKAVPSIINKIFGIDVGAGSFKDVGKMVKTAATVGLGTAIGVGASAGTGVAGFVGAFKSGQRGGNLALAAGRGVLNTIGGALRGFGGGIRGNVTAGISSAKRNLSDMDAYSQGITASALTGGAIFGKVGMDYASRADREVQNLVDENTKFDEFNNNYKGTIESMADSSKFMTTLAAARSKNLITGKQYEDIREKFIEEQIAHAGDKNYQGTSFKDMLTSVGVQDLSKFDFNLDEKMAAEGKSMEMKELLIRANNNIKTNSSVREAIKADTDASRISTITTFADLKTIDSAVKTKKRENATNIDNVKQTDRYREAVAAREINKNNQ